MSQIWSCKHPPIFCGATIHRATENLVLIPVDLEAPKWWTCRMGCQPVVYTHTLPALEMLISLYIRHILGGGVEYETWEPSGNPRSTARTCKLCTNRVEVEKEPPTSVPSQVTWGKVEAQCNLNSLKYWCFVCQYKVMPFGMHNAPPHSGYVLERINKTLHFTVKAQSRQHTQILLSWC